MLSLSSNSLKDSITGLGSTLKSARFSDIRDRGKRICKAKSANLNAERNLRFSENFRDKISSNNGIGYEFCVDQCLQKSAHS
jgi:hypothetical protein